MYGQSKGFRIGWRRDVYNMKNANLPCCSRIATCFDGTTRWQIKCDTRYLCDIHVALSVSVDRVCILHAPPLFFCFPRNDLHSVSLLSLFLSFARNADREFISSTLCVYAYVIASLAVYVRKMTYLSLATFHDSTVDSTSPASMCDFASFVFRILRSWIDNIVVLRRAKNSLKIIRRIRLFTSHRFNRKLRRNRRSRFLEYGRVCNNRYSVYCHIAIISRDKTGRSTIIPAISIEINIVIPIGFRERFSY